MERQHFTVWALCGLLTFCLLILESRYIVFLFSGEEAPQYPWQACCEGLWAALAFCTLLLKSLTLNILHFWNLPSDEPNTSPPSVTELQPFVLISPRLDRFTCPLVSPGVGHPKRPKCPDFPPCPRGCQYCALCSAGVSCSPGPVVSPLPSHLHRPLDSSHDPAPLLGSHGHPLTPSPALPLQRPPPSRHLLLTSLFLSWGPSLLPPSRPLLGTLPTPKGQGEWCVATPQCGTPASLQLPHLPVPPSALWLSPRPSCHTLGPRLSLTVGLSAQARPSAWGAACWGFSPRDLETTNLKEQHLNSLSQGLTSLFLQSSLFYRSRNKELRVYGQQSTYRVKT